MVAKTASVAGHFDGHGEVLKRYMWHLPMQHVQGYTGSHRTRPSRNYSLRIVSAAARATANKTKMQNLTTLLTILMASRYYTAHIAQWRRFVAFIKATKYCHRASTCSDRHQSDMPTPISGAYFIVKSLKKSLSCPNNNRGVTHQTDEKHLNNMSEYFVGVLKSKTNLAPITRMVVDTMSAVKSRRLLKVLLDRLNHDLDQ